MSKLFIAGFPLLLLIVTRASAADSNCAATHNATAKALKAQGQFREAITQYQLAYQCSPEAKYLYNIAANHHRLIDAGAGEADARKAIDFYMRYLARYAEVEHHKADDLPEVEGFIKILVDRFPQFSSSVPLGRQTDPTGAEKPAIIDPQGLRATTLPPPMRSPPSELRPHRPGLDANVSRSWRNQSMSIPRKVGLALLGIGVVVGSGTAVAGWYAWDAKSAYAAHCYRFPTSTPSCFGTVNRYNVAEGLSISSAVLSGISLTAAVALLALSRDFESSRVALHETTAPRFDCAAGPGQIGISCLGSF